MLDWSIFNNFHRLLLCFWNRNTTNSYKFTRQLLLQKKYVLPKMNEKTPVPSISNAVYSISETNSSGLGLRLYRKYCFVLGEICIWKSMNFTVILELLSTQENVEDYSRTKYTWKTNGNIKKYNNCSCNLSKCIR